MHTTCIAFDIICRCALDAYLFVFDKNSRLTPSLLLFLYFSRDYFLTDRGRGGYDRYDEPRGRGGGDGGGYRDDRYDDRGGGRKCSLLSLKHALRVGMASGVAFPSVSVLILTYAEMLSPLVSQVVEDTAMTTVVVEEATGVVEEAIGVAMMIAVEGTR